jgi:hypothetical protein
MKRRLKMDPRRHPLLENDLDLCPDGGGIGAKELDKELFEICGCNLCWHKIRRVFMVYRIRGNKSKFYMDLLPNKHFPLTSSLIPMISSTVKAANAAESDDPVKAIYEYFNRAKTIKKEGIKSFVDDRFPEFRKYAERSWQKLNNKYSRPCTVPDMSTAYNLK